MRFGEIENPLFFFTFFIGDREHARFTFGSVRGGEGDLLIATTSRLAWTTKPISKEKLLHLPKENKSLFVEKGEDGLPWDE